MKTLLLPFLFLIGVVSATAQYCIPTSSVVTVTGDFINHVTLGTLYGRYQQTIDLAQQPAGLYSVLVATRRKVTTHHIVIK